MRQMCNNCTWKLKTKTFQCSTFLLLPLPKNRLTHCQCDACCLCFSPLNSSVPFPRGMHNTWNAQDIFQISFYLLCIYFWMHSHSPTLNKIKWALLSWTLVFLLYKLNLKKKLYENEGDTLITQWDSSESNKLILHKFIIPSTQRFSTCLHEGLKVSCWYAAPVIKKVF